MEIDVDSLDRYTTYYKAYYNNGLLVKFEKYIDGNLVGYDEYEYWENSKKLKTQVLVNDIGEKRINHYNKRGKPIKE